MMVTLRAPWAQPWTKPNACKECLPGTQLNYRVCLTSVSLLLWRLLWDNVSRQARCFWHHLLAVARGIGPSNHYSFQDVSTNTAQRYVSWDTIWWCCFSGRNLCCSTIPQVCSGWPKRLRHRFPSHGECVTILPVPGFSSKWGSHKHWAYCHSRY